MIGLNIVDRFDPVLPTEGEKSLQIVPVRFDGVFAEGLLKPQKGEKGIEIR